MIRLAAAVAVAILGWASGAVADEAPVKWNWYWAGITRSAQVGTDGLDPVMSRFGTATISIGDGKIHAVMDDLSVGNSGITFDADIAAGGRLRGALTGFELDDGRTSTLWIGQTSEAALPASPTLATVLCAHREIVLRPALASGKPLANGEVLVFVQQKTDRRC
jgi:hypothetical protein